MTTRAGSCEPPDVQAFFDRLLARSAQLRVPELFRPRPLEALYQVLDREGVSVTALPTSALTDEQLIGIMTYRLAQYVALGYVSRTFVYESGLEHESLENVDIDDVHVVAGSATTGELLCYVVIKAGPNGADGATMRTPGRPLLPVERIHGAGVFSRLSPLGDLPLSGVCELERFVKNQQHAARDALSIRAPVETALAAFRVLASGALPGVQAVVGDIEEGVAKRNLDFFHVPTAVLHGVVPYVPEETYPSPSYERQNRYPFAFLCSDILTDRLDAIDKALQVPGERGVAELLELRRDDAVPPSSLEPDDRAGTLLDAPIKQQGVDMGTRRELIDLGAWLRTLDVFTSLTAAEAAAVATFMQPIDVSTGGHIIHQGETDDDLYVIRRGAAEVHVVGDGGARTVVATLGAGDCIGEVALVTGARRSADVIATEPTHLLRLSKHAYQSYLTRIGGIDHQLTSLARRRTPPPGSEARRHDPPADRLAAFRSALPRDRVVSSTGVIERRYRRNVTALDRDIPFVVRPHDESEVEAIVALANLHGVALYPFSTGRNWGLGSKLPVVDGCVLVDLSLMDRIVEVNDDFAYAIIEPGVTQGMLAERLRDDHPHLTMNFTGSFAHTSIVGNVLERGDGASARVHDLLGVQGFLGNGQRFQAGGLWDRVGGSEPSHHSRYVAGPDLTGLFAQSNFGVVTRLAFRLIHKPERRHLLWGVAADDQLERVVDTFDHYGRQGVIDRGSVNIGYANRFVQARSTLDPRGEPADSGDALWNYYLLVSGTTRVADAAVDELRESLAPLSDDLGVVLVDQEHTTAAALPSFLLPLLTPLLGAPDAESIKLIYALTGTPMPADPGELDADQTPFGMTCYIGIVPPCGQCARRASAIVASLTAAFDLNLKLSLFGDGRSLTTIHFRTDEPEQVSRAHACEAALWDAMVSAGFPPYRTSIAQMDRLVRLQPEFFKTVTTLKRALDPNDVISPGRYCPVTPERADG